MTVETAVVIGAGHSHLHGIICAAGFDGWIGGLDRNRRQNRVHEKAAAADAEGQHAEGS